MTVQAERRRLSTRIPIIQLRDTLIVSIQVALTDRQISSLKDDITLAIRRHGPRGLVIDISGVDILDSFISRTLRDIGLIARLMGVRAVISGVNPMMAMTLVEMGLGLEGLATALNLDMALEVLSHAKQRRATKRGARQR